MSLRFRAHDVDLLRLAMEKADSHKKMDGLRAALQHYVGTKAMPLDAATLEIIRDEARAEARRELTRRRRRGAS